MQPTDINFSPTDCTNALISWTAPASDRNIATHYIYRDGIFLADTNTAPNYNDTQALTIGIQYMYSLTANSCAGNSSTTDKSYTSEGKIVILGIL